MFLRATWRAALCFILASPRTTSFLLDSRGAPGKVSNLLVLTNVLVLLKFPAGLSCGESGQGLALNTYPRLAPRLKKEYGCTCTLVPSLSLYGLFWSELFNSHQCCTFACACRNFRQALQQCLALARLHERLHFACFSSRSVRSYFALGSENFIFSFPSLVFTLTCCVAHSSVHLFLVAYHAYYKKLAGSVLAVLIPTQRNSHAIFWCIFYSSPNYSHQRAFLVVSKLSALSPNNCAFCA